MHIMRFTERSMHFIFRILINTKNCSFKISEKIVFSHFSTDFLDSFSKDRKIGNIYVFVRFAIFTSFRKENNFSFLSTIFEKSGFFKITESTGYK